MLETGTIAPAFTLQDQDGVTHSSDELKGKWSIIYFYPKDDTPGCTKEACTIAEIYQDFSSMGVTVFGVSKDSIASHKKFAEKYNLPFTLLADTDTQMIADYEALVEKSMFGKKIRGTARITYIINPEGKIEKAYKKVTPADHAVELLKDLEELV